MTDCNLYTRSWLRVCLLVHTRIWMWTFELRCVFGVVCVYRSYVWVCPHQIRKYLLSNVSMTYRMREEKKQWRFIFSFCVYVTKIVSDFFRSSSIRLLFGSFKFQAYTKWHHATPFISFLFVCLFFSLSFVDVYLFLAHFTHANTHTILAELFVNFSNDNVRTHAHLHAPQNENQPMVISNKHTFKRILTNDQRFAILV